MSSFPPYYHIFWVYIPDNFKLVNYSVRNKNDSNISATVTIQDISSTVHTVISSNSYTKKKQTVFTLTSSSSSPLTTIYSIEVYECWHLIADVLLLKVSVMFCLLSWFIIAEIRNRLVRRTVTALRSVEDRLKIIKVFNNLIRFLIIFEKVWLFLKYERPTSDKSAILYIMHCIIETTLF